MSIYVRKLYYASTGSTVISPSFDSFWDDSSGADRKPANWDSKTNTAYDLVNRSGYFGFTITGVGVLPLRRYIAVRQYVTPPLGQSINVDYPSGAPYFWGDFTLGVIPMAMYARYAANTAITSGGGDIRNVKVYASCIVRAFDASGALIGTIADLVKPSEIGYARSSINGGHYLATYPFGPFTSYPNTQVFGLVPTDRLVMEFGFEVLILAAYAQTYPFNTSVSVDVEFGDPILDSDLAQVYPPTTPSMDTARGVPWGGFIFNASAAGSGFVGGWNYVRRRNAIILAKVVSLVETQQPSNSSQLNDVLGNSRGFNS